MTKKTPAPTAAPVEPVASAPEQPQIEHLSRATAEPAPAVPEPAAAPEVPALINVRILAKCEHGEPNDVVELAPAEAKALAGVVDADPVAVAYAESLK